MKKYIMSIGLMLFVFLFPMSFTVTAEAATYVHDQADLISDAEEAALEEKAKSYSEQYDCGIYLMTVNDYVSYEEAGNIYLNQGFGMGESRDGVFLILAMADRDYHLMTYGNGKEIFLDAGMEYMEGEFLGPLGNNKWYEGFDAYIESSGKLLQMAADGKPMTWQRKPGVAGLGMVFSVILGLLLSLIVAGGFKSQMESVHAGANANRYIVAGSLDLREKQDKFRVRTTTRTKIQKNNGGKSGGRSGGGGGFSGRSGKF